MHFTKWQGCGNDFVFVNGLSTDPAPAIAHCREICDRHFGIGADGLILILPSDKADLRMRIYNADGSEAEMCGNGIRCFAKWARELGLVTGSRFSVETGAGILYPEFSDDGSVRVDMGAPILEAAEIPTAELGEGRVISVPLSVASLGRTFTVTCVSMGNPHCVIFTDDISDEALTTFGPAIEKDSHFPKKVNVEFVKQIDAKTLRMRVWERGAAVTLACGTGSCATGVAAVLNGRIEKEAKLILDGGTLTVSWEPGGRVFMTGPAEKVFEGDIDL